MDQPLAFTLTAGYALPSGRTAGPAAPAAGALPGSPAEGRQQTAQTHLPGQMSLAGSPTDTDTEGSGRFAAAVGGPAPMDVATGGNAAPKDADETATEDEAVALETLASMVSPLTTSTPVQL